MSDFILGLDLGQAQDYTAVSILQVLGKAEKSRSYQLRHLERLPLGTIYPTVVAHIKELMERDPLRGCARLVVDATGVGKPVIDMFQQERLRPIGIIITGGNEVASVRGGYHVPKRDLVTTLQVLFQAGKLKVATELPYANTFVTELLGFKVKISTRGHDTYEAWREGIHDDLVLSVALAAWWGQRVAKASVKKLGTMAKQSAEIVGGGYS